MVLVVKDETGLLVDHFSVMCKLQINTEILSSAENVSQYEALREEIVGAILRLTLLESQIQRAPPNCQWGLLFVTSSEEYGDQAESVQAALSSGEWLVDSNQLPEQLSLAAKVE